MPTEITFIQYLRPNGRKVPVLIDMEDAELGQKAVEVKAKGYEFCIELLTTGIVSMTIENNNTSDEDNMTLAAHELCANGEPVIAAVRKLTETAWNKIQGGKTNDHQEDN